MNRININEIYLTYPVEELFLSLTKNLVVKKDNIIYPDRIFYMKNINNKLNYIFEYDLKNSNIYTSYYNFDIFFIKNLTLIIIKP